jgi:hypothetical protein
MAGLRTDAKEKVFRRELAELKKHEDFRLCVVEVGAGVGIPTVIDFSEGLLQQFHQAKLIPINPTVVAADHNTICPSWTKRCSLQVCSNIAGLSVSASPIPPSLTPKGLLSCLPREVRGWLQDCLSESNK